MLQQFDSEKSAQIVSPEKTTGSGENDRIRKTSGSALEGVHLASCTQVGRLMARTEPRLFADPIVFAPFCGSYRFTDLVDFTGRIVLRGLLRIKLL